MSRKHTERIRPAHHGLSTVILFSSALLMVGAATAAGEDALPQAGVGGTNETFQLKGNAPKGETVFRNNCVACHGIDGDGKGPLAGAFDPPPGIFTDAKRMATLSDLYLYTIVKDGGPAVGKCMEMGSWKRTLNDQQVRDVVAYVKLFSVKKPEPERKRR